MSTTRWARCDEHNDYEEDGDENVGGEDDSN